MFDLNGKVAVITGAGSGIGRGIALALAQAGADILASDADGVHAEETAELVRKVGRRAVSNQADVRDRDQLEQMAELAMRELGGLHIAVANAGIGRGGSILTMSEDDFDTQMGVNLKGVWLGMKYQIPHMLAKGGGAIVNTASSAGVTGIPNVALYTASKHGVVGLTKATALELAASKIRVNAVAPGPVDTGLLHRMIGGNIDVSVIAGQVPMKRVSQPEETARAILWLCSDEASFVTGHTLVVDGGLTVG